MIDFDQLNNYREEIKGDMLFSTLGTTLKKAGGKEQQYKIDYTYQYNVAKIAFENKVPNYVLVSSMGANARAKVFYSKMKGELDEIVQQFNFKRIVIFRPSILDGDRKEKRPSEQFSLKLMRFVTKYFAKKYKPTKDSVLASAMINSILENPNKDKIQIYELDKIDQLVH